MDFTFTDLLHYQCHSQIVLSTDLLDKIGILFKSYPAGFLREATMNSPSKAKNGPPELFFDNFLFYGKALRLSRKLPKNCSRAILTLEEATLESRPLGSRSQTGGSWPTRTGNRSFHLKGPNMEGSNIMYMGGRADPLGRPPHCSKYLVSPISTHFWFALPFQTLPPTKLTGFPISEKFGNHSTRVLTQCFHRSRAKTAGKGLLISNLCSHPTMGFLHCSEQVATIQPTLQDFCEDNTEYRYSTPYSL